MNSNDETVFSDNTLNKILSLPLVEFRTLAEELSDDIMMSVDSIDLDDDNELIQFRESLTVVLQACPDFLGFLVGVSADEVEDYVLDDLLGDY